MDKIKLGRTNLMVSKTAFGALPIQRLSTEEAVRLVKSAYEQGINYFDTANGYTDSEEKLGIAFKGIRDKVIISTKTAATDKKGALAHIELSLKRMQTDYIDLIQFHNPALIPDINDPDGAFAAALEAKKKGYVRHIGITNHRGDVALKAIRTGNFETLQFPFSHLASQSDIDIVNECAALDVGFIVMKGLSGGMLTNARACYAFMQNYPNVVPIWGIQRQCELDEWIALTAENPRIDDEIRAVIEADRKDLVGNFCRGCGYCLPCPADINIPMAARIKELLRRSPTENLITDEYANSMNRINNCINCGACKNRCPYELNTPELLKSMLNSYHEIRNEILIKS